MPESDPSESDGIPRSFPRPFFPYPAPVPGRSLRQTPSNPPSPRPDSGRPSPTQRHAARTRRAPSPGAPSVSDGAPRGLGKAGRDPAGPSLLARPGRFLTPAHNPRRFPQGTVVRVDPSRSRSRRTYDRLQAERPWLKRPPHTSSRQLSSPSTAPRRTPPPPPLTRVRAEQVGAAARVLAPPAAQRLRSVRYAPRPGRRRRRRRQRERIGVVARRRSASARTRAAAARRRGRRLPTTAAPHAQTKGS